jgi:DNA helicase-2/ATP-dependent DNA helicase PcrA
MSRDYVLQPFPSGKSPRIDYPRELNEQQLEAVTAAPGPALVIAGAGSGKTRTLTYRVAYLLEQGVSAERILLLTFTNKAAREMMQRVAALLDGDMPALWGGTFHSIGNRILRLHADRFGLTRDFTILDREDAVHLLKACLSDAGHSGKGEHFPKAEVLSELFSFSVNTEIPLAKLVEDRLSQFLELTGEIESIRASYDDRRRTTNSVNFDDLLVLWNRLLREDADLCERYQRRFQFILVDEYQDTNRLQGDLIDRLAARHRNLMAVGDDAQSIYAWRGAHYDNLLRFADRYPDVRVFKVETNYRSTPEILAVANSVIEHNAHRFPKILVPHRGSSEKPVLVGCMTAADQATFVAQRAVELHEQGESLNQIAVLYRSHFHAVELQLEFTRRQIPFSITSGIRFFEQSHIKDVTSYLKLLVNPRDEVPFKRLVQLLPGIGPKAARKLWVEFQSRLGLVSESSEAVAGSQVAVALQACATFVPRKAAVAWAQFTATLSQLQLEAAPKGAGAMIRLVLDAGYEDLLRENLDRFESRREDLVQLGEFAAQFDSPERFLAELALLGEIDAESEPEESTDERIRLSTVHQAKGLEFNVVFVVMLCEGMFPSGRSLESANGVEEERRLLYVALTRARNELYLSYPHIRTLAGGANEGFLRPSRFLEEIPAGLLATWNLRSFG